MSKKTKVVNIGGILVEVDDEPKNIVQMDLGDGKTIGVEVDDEPKNIVQMDLGNGRTIGVEVDDKPRKVVDIGGILVEVGCDEPADDEDES